MSARFALVIATILSTLAWTTAARAVVNGSPAPIEDRRLDAVGLLLTASNAPCGGWISGTCSLIGPDLVLMTRHSVQTLQLGLPADNGRSHRVWFRRGVDGAVNNYYSSVPDQDCPSPHQEIWIKKFYGCPQFGVDMVIGVLEHAPVGITPLPVDLNGSPSGGDRVTLAGWGFDGVCFQQGQAWTLRTGSGVIPSPAMTGNTFVYNNSQLVSGCFTLRGGEQSVIGNLHDSGAPLLMEFPLNDGTGRTELRIVALATGVNNAQRVRAWNAGGGQPQLVQGGTSPGGTPTPGCRADINGDGEVTATDLHAYLQLFLAGDQRANLDGQAALGLADLMQYLRWFTAGC